MKLHIDISFRVSKFIKLFCLSDLLLFAGWGFIEPLFALFIVNQIEGGTMITVGMLAAIYWIIKSLIQIPIANFLDKTDGEKDDFYVLVISLVFVGITAFLFALATQVWHLILIQFFHALAMGLYFPAWTGIFSRHLDQKHEALDWALNSTLIGLGTGITGFIGGILANWVGFTAIFILVGFLSLLSAVIIITAPNLMFPKKKQGEELFIKDHAPI